MAALPPGCYAVPHPNVILTRILVFKHWREPMDLHGSNILGAEVSKCGAATFRGCDPASGQELDTAFHEATEGEAAKAMEMADEAYASYRAQPPEAIASFLDQIASGLEAAGDALLARAHLETRLPEARLIYERNRTTGQLRMFAALVREGSWVDACIDLADPSRTPTPQPDLRKMLVSLGPVVVFGASNFPLAFSICGGDTASALAAGNPVVAKAHPAHPGTSEIAARVIQEAIRKTAMPPGVFSMVQGRRPELSLALVRHPATRAVGFTGSLQAGRALFDAAATRPSPIPFFAEMGSLNPVFILPGALKAKTAEIAQKLAGSVTLGLGQMCTKPGQIAAIKSPELGLLVEKLAASTSSTPLGAMLYSGIAERYRDGLLQRSRAAGVRLATPANRDTTEVNDGATVSAAVLVSDAPSFFEDPTLGQELFGPATLVTECESREHLAEIARGLEGQLTVTVHGTEEDLREYASLISVLREKAGRMIFGGVPTGVEVKPAMHHGGPYPATTDPRFTSVGPAAILRFARPVCYQDCPQEWLPAELKDANPRNIFRLVNGEWTRGAVTATSH
jgi:NADP-dependent aldehyde dehydrogenase